MTSDPHGQRRGFRLFPFYTAPDIYLYDSTSNWDELESLSFNFPDGQRYSTLFKHVLDICVSSFENDV